MDNQSVSPSTPTAVGQQLHVTQSTLSQQTQQAQDDVLLRQQQMVVEECDYDENPTVLYQAIEAKEWDYAMKLFHSNLCEGESSTWILRKETNGKLRWRLLPLHAAIIFGSPVPLVECLIADYPEAAQCKDDRGMLPLHLAFRNEGSASWEIIEELLSVFPLAIFVKDRKGRTPLQCGIQLTTTQHKIQQQQLRSNQQQNQQNSNATVASSTASVSNLSVSSLPNQSNTFKSIVTVLDLYSQIVISAEKQRSQKDAKKHVESKMTQIQEDHLYTLLTLKQEWTNQQIEATKEIQRLKCEQQRLLDQIHEQQISITNLKSSEEDLRQKLKDISTGFRHDHPLREPLPTTICNPMIPTEMTATTIESNGLIQNVENDQLKLTIQKLLKEQADDHRKLQSLMDHLERLTKERRQVLEILMGSSSRIHGSSETQAQPEQPQQHIDTINPTMTKEEPHHEVTLEEWREWLQDHEKRMVRYKATTITTTTTTTMMDDHDDGDEKKDEISTVHTGSEDR